MRLPAALALLALGAASAAEPPSPPPYLGELAGKARSLGLARRAQWLTLLHFQDPWWGAPRSRAYNPAFFLSPRGRFDPEAELEATLAAFLREPPSNPKEQHPQCRFPARYAWLRGELGFDPARLPERACPRFEEWRGALQAGGATLVFADAYLNNPSSMYGHTFLRLDREGRKPREELLDYTVNFAATAPGMNDALFALRGLTGGLEGLFSTLPYYVKVQEYSNMESRDLWEYSLSLSREEVDRLTRHAWETGSARFGYYFFTQNCSLQLLSLLDAARPSLRLVDSFGFGVAPLDTVRALLREPGLVSSVRYRPSLQSSMLARRARLSPGERRRALALASGSAPPGSAAADPEREALVLDSALDLLRYRSSRAGSGATGSEAVERAVLLRRRLLPPARLEPVPAPAASPDSGHATHRLSLGGGASDLAPFWELSWRAALHDLADAPQGYPPYSELEMGGLRLRYDAGVKEAYLERLDLARILSLSPWDGWTGRRSWKISTGVDQAKELGCRGMSCAYYQLNGGTGWALGGGSRPWLLYGLGEADLGLGPPLRADWRLGGGGTAGLLLDLPRLGRLQLEGSWLGYPLGDSRPRRKVALLHSLPLTRELALLLRLERRPPRDEAGLSLQLHY